MGQLTMPHENLCLWKPQRDTQEPLRQLWSGDYALAQSMNSPGGLLLPGGRMLAAEPHSLHSYRSCFQFLNLFERTEELLKPCRLAGQDSREGLGRRGHSDIQSFLPEPFVFWSQGERPGPWSLSRRRAVAEGQRNLQHFWSRETSLKTKIPE